MAERRQRVFLRLSNVEHVRLRTGMWLGQNSLSTYEQHFFRYDGRSKTWRVEHREIEEIPAKMKCLDEACMNCVDEYRRNLADPSLRPRDRMSFLRVELSDDRRRVTVTDNGRGIPEANAEGVFLHLMYGENFDDKAREEHVAGQNGVGISLVRIVSSHFRVRTVCEGRCYEKLFTVNEPLLEALKGLGLSPAEVEACVKHFDEHSNFDACTVLTAKQKKALEPLMRRHLLLPRVRTVPASEHGTTVEFELDPKYFNGLDTRFDPELVEQYLLEIALTNPGLEVSFLHKGRTRTWCFRKGMDELFEGREDVYKLTHQAPDLPSKMDLTAYIVMGPGRHLVWVNSNFASLGGSAIEYLENRLCDEIRKKPAIASLERKLGTQATRNDVRACFHMFVNLKVLNPRFKSQDKSYLINDLNQEMRDAVDRHLDRLLRKTTLLEDIKTQMERRTHLKALEDAAKGVRKASRVTIPKLIPPTGDPDDPGRVLFIAEGDSAIAGLRPVRDPKLHGLFPLRGKPMNVQGMSLAKAMANEELKNIVAILGLPLDRKVKSLDELNYRKVAIITDADFDGYAIRSLMLSFFYEYWPELYDLGFVHICAAPLYEVEVRWPGKEKTELRFCVDDEAYDRLAASVKRAGGEIVRKKRNKGLGETGKEAMRYALTHGVVRIGVRKAKDADRVQRLWFHKDLAEERRKVIAEYSMRFYEE